MASRESGQEAETLTGMCSQSPAGVVNLVDFTAASLITTVAMTRAKPNSNRRPS
jgi:hypothetical protein